MSNRRGREGRPYILLCALFGVCGLAAGEPSWEETRQRAFDMVWTTVHDSYVDPTFGGVDWEQARSTFAARLDEAADNEALRRILRGMLEKLGQSHFAIIPREAAVFTPKDRARQGTVGITVVGTPAAVTIGDVRSDSPAAAAGLKPGDVIRAVDGRDVSQVRASIADNEWTDSKKSAYVVDFVSARLQGPVGVSVSLSVRTEDGAEKTVSVAAEAHTGAWSEPVGHFPSIPIACETRYEVPGVAYLRISSFAPSLMPQIRGFIRSLKASDALVIDLRGNRGGVTAMAVGVAGLLVKTELSLGIMRVRHGRTQFDVYPQASAFLGPVALLIDSASASTSEILAAGLQEAKRVRIFGETSGGAALPSAFKTLPTGDLFQFAVADVQTPSGKTIEGVGVTPDVAVARTGSDLAAGQDPPLAEAVAWLRRQARGNSPSSTVNPPAKSP